MNKPFFFGIIINLYFFPLSLGRCIDIKATTVPTKQCFCQPGFMGTQCGIRSKIATKDYNVTDFKRVPFQKVDFLYRIDGDEVEGIIIGKQTISWLGFGQYIPA